MNCITIFSPADGESVPMETVPDEAFSQNTMGVGVAIEPSGEVFCAPCDGVITAVAGAKHAFCLQGDNGAELLVHIGLDTVKLDGKGFTCYVEPGEHVQAGERVIKVNARLCRKHGLRMISPILILNPDEMGTVSFVHGAVRAGKTAVITAQKDE